MGRSRESPALFGDPRTTVTLPVEIGLPPVDTRGEHVFAIFGLKEWIFKKCFDFHQKFMTNGASTCRDITQSANITYST